MFILVQTKNVEANIKNIFCVNSLYLNCFILNYEFFNKITKDGINHKMIYMVE